MPKSATKPAAAQAPLPGTGNEPPVHSIRYRNIKASIWRNAGDKGVFYSVTVVRSWQDEQKNWHDSTSFNFNDLPHVAKAINDCHSWIAWQNRQQSKSSAG